MSCNWSRFHVGAAVLAVGLSYATPAKAQGEVDVGFFYDGLAPFGQWVESPQYGWAWYPTGVEVGWRPYTDGHWIFTDEFGWYWESDWEWGWAPFHYGRWTFDDAYGWVWIPGSEWGPAWVTWRTGGGFIGWAPLPPGQSSPCRRQSQSPSKAGIAPPPGPGVSRPESDRWDNPPPGFDTRNRRPRQADPAPHAAWMPSRGGSRTFPGAPFSLPTRQSTR